jgi:RNA polymerase sigma-70 factor (ECF subfamily)
MIHTIHVSNSLQMKGFATSGGIRHRRGHALLKTASHAREREFERLYLESYGLVYGFVRARMSCESDAEDVVAEAYMKAARAFASFDSSRAKFSTWVTTIARNCMASHYRRVRPVSALDDAPQEAYAVAGGQDAVDDLLLAEQLLACLDNDERELVALKYRDGLRNVDIARELNMNASTVSTVLARALAKMRDVAERST